MIKMKIIEDVLMFRCFDVCSRCCVGVEERKLAFPAISRGGQAAENALPYPSVVDLLTPIDKKV